MPYTIGDNGDRVWVISKNKEKIWWLSRTQAQAIHDALAAVCAGDCACSKGEDDEGVTIATDIRAGK